MGCNYVVEYSVSQKCWNVSTLDEALNTNINMMLMGKSNDYKIIAIVKTNEEASKIIEGLKDKL